MITFVNFSVNKNFIFVFFTVFVAAPGIPIRSIAGIGGHNNVTRILAEHSDIPTAGNYVSVQLRGNHVLTGILRNESTGNTLENRFYVWFTDRSFLVADLQPLEPLHITDSQNYQFSRCFIQIRPDFYLSAFLKPSRQENQIPNVTTVMFKQRNPSITLKGTPAYIDGFLPTWARSITP